MTFYSKRDLSLKAALRPRALDLARKLTPMDMVNTIGVMAEYDIFVHEGFGA